MKPVLWREDAPKAVKIMTPDCPFDSRLSAYHDGELNNEGRLAVERHLEACPACAGQLEQLRGMSQMLMTAHSDGITPDELARVHAAVDAVEAPYGQINWSGLRQVAGFLMAAAASIILIGGAWVLEAPRSSAAPRPHVVPYASSMLPWERVAMGLPADLPARTPGETGPAYAAGDARLADWMVRQLDPNSQNLWLP